MSATLPPYARSPTPSYASLPRPNVEDTVEYTPRHGRIEHPFGHITKQLRNGVTVIFRDQDPETRADPTYGNNASVCGEVGLDNPRDVLAIIVKVIIIFDLSVFVFIQSFCSWSLARIFPRLMQEIRPRNLLIDDSLSGRPPVQVDVLALSRSLWLCLRHTKRKATSIVSLPPLR